jgi:transcription elongation factor Elf1
MKMARKKEKADPDHDRTLFDKKCITCGTWMQRSKNISKNGARSFTYFCSECGLSYSVDE